MPPDSSPCTLELKLLFAWRSQEGSNELVNLQTITWNLNFANARGKTRERDATRRWWLPDRKLAGECR